MEPDLQVGEIFCRRGGSHEAVKIHQQVILAPLYDLMCTAAYPEIHANLAMKVGGRPRLEAFTPDTWDDFAGEVAVGAPYVRRRARQFADRALAAIPEVVGVIVAEGFGGEDLDRFAVVATDRAKTLAAISEGVRQSRRHEIRRNPSLS